VSHVSVHLSEEILKALEFKLAIRLKSWKIPILKTFNRGDVDMGPVMSFEKFDRNTGDETGIGQRIRLFHQVHLVCLRFA